MLKVLFNYNFVPLYFSILNFCFFIWSLDYIYLTTWVTSYFTDSDYPAVLGHDLWCVTNQICLLMRHLEKSSDYKKREDATSEPVAYF